MDIVENYHIEITKTEFEDIVELYGIILKGIKTSGYPNNINIKFKSKEHKEQIRSMLNEMLNIEFEDVNIEANTKQF
jgi:hypothetical protein